jgi:hypothetical protein
MGTTPAAVGGTATINYTYLNSSNLMLTPATVTVSAAAYAAATPGAADLLTLHTFYSSPGAVPSVGASRPDPDIIAQAGWNNVAATVEAPVGISLPSSIRLDFQVNYGSPNKLSPFGIPDGALPTQAVLVNGYSQVALANAGTPLQAGEPAVRVQADGSLTGSFHLDLPLSSSGTSPQFSVSLSSNLMNLLNNGSGTIQNSMSLSLTGILLADGTPIDSKGYSVTFESGLPSPPSVPEPGTWAIWLVTAVSGGWILRRRIPLRTLRRS